MFILLQNTGISFSLKFTAFLIMAFAPSRIPSTSRTPKLCLENVIKLYLKVRSFSYTKDYVAKYKIKEKEVKKKALRKDMKQSSNEK